MADTLMVDGKPLMAWLSEVMQGAGVEEEDGIAGLLVEAVHHARTLSPDGMIAETSGYWTMLVRGAALTYVDALATVRAQREEIAALKQRIEMYESVHEAGCALPNDHPGRCSTEATRG